MSLSRAGMILRNPTVNSRIKLAATADPAHPIVGDLPAGFDSFEPLRDVVVNLRVHCGRPDYWLNFRNIMTNEGVSDNR